MEGLCPDKLCGALQTHFHEWGRLPVILALRQTQFTVHDKLCGGFKVGVAVGDGLGVLRRELAQHPCGKVVVRVGLCADADADAGEILPAQPGNDALQAVVPARRAGGTDAQLAGCLSSHSTSTWSAGILKKPAMGAMESPERFM